MNGNLGTVVPLGCSLLLCVRKKLHLSRWSLFEHSTDTWNFMALTTLCTREDRDNGIGFARESKAFNYFGIWYKRGTVFIIGCVNGTTRCPLTTNFFFTFFWHIFVFLQFMSFFFNFVSIIQKLFWLFLINFFCLFYT